MSSNPDPKPQRRKRIARAEGDKPSRRTAAGQYEVGYGKPPVSTRFVKGQSGNPRGRPRKPRPQPPRLSDAPSDRYLEEEAYRSVALRENGQGIELPTIQAVVRALAMGAIKGNRLSQKYFLEYVARQEERHLELKVQDYLRLEALKRDGEKVLAEYERRGLPPPELFPHPEDILLKPSTAEAYVHGPETPEDVHFYEHAVQTRDHALLRSAHANKIRKKTSAKLEDDGICMFLLCAQLLDRVLPPRYRWKDNANLYLFMDYRSLTKRQRERRIAVEFAQLKATQPRPTSITPEVEWEMDRIASWIKRSQDARSDGAVAG